MPNTYTPQTWTDGVSSASAARMGVIETGVQGAWASELAYNQFTTNQTSTAVSAATAVAVVTSSAVTYDGSTAIMLHFYCADVSHSVSGTTIVFELYDSSTDLMILGRFNAGDGSHTQNFTGFRRFTPSAASHTYSVRMWSTAAGTATAAATTGSGGTDAPGFIRIVRA